MKNLYPLAFLTLLVWSCHKKVETQPQPIVRIIYSFALLKSENPALHKDVYATIEGDSIWIPIPKGTTVNSLVPTIGYEGASLSPSSKIAQDFRQTVIYSVKAVDSSRQDYKAVIRYMDTVKQITGFVFRKADNPALSQDIVGKILGDSISAITPTGIDVKGLIPTITYTGKSLSPQSGVPNDFRTPATYIVTAEDSSATVYTVYTGYHSDIFAVGQDGYLYDINAFNGYMRWKYYVGGAGTPVFSNDAVFVAGANNVVYSINATDGTLNWKNTSPLGNYNLGLPVANYGHIYFSGSGYLSDSNSIAHYAGFIYCLDAQTGSDVWLKELNTGYSYSDSRITNVTVENNIACAYDIMNGLFAFNASDGSAAWSRVGDMLGRANPAIANGQIYYGVEGGIANLNVTNGLQSWRIVNNLSYTSPTINNNTIYMAANNSLLAFNLDGTIKWQSPYGQPNDAMFAPLTLDNTVFVCNSSRRLLAFDANSGSLNWFRESYYQYPVIANGTIYITDLNNFIHCIDPTSGNTIWITSGFASFSSPFCVVDPLGNTFHVGDSGGQN